MPATFSLRVAPWSRALFFVFAAGLSPAAEPFVPSVPDKQPEPPFPAVPDAAGVRMLVPGFTVTELPVKLTSLNNIEYAADGRLYAGGYDGRFHLLRDTNGDGLEDKVDTFSPEAGPNYPLGIVVREGMPWAVLTDEVVRWKDGNGDGIPDLRETVIKGFDDPELVQAPYLNHRRVDGSMALAVGADGALYVTMGNAGPGNAYWTDDKGVAHYATSKRRGCLLKISKDGKVEQLNSGLRYIMSLQFNREGDLFGSEQEGATWVPNGNPFDELLHLEPGRHYGFPPRHPKWLPDVIDEPSVWDFAPQHQSVCGFRFNGPAKDRGRFGPEFWAEDALLTGESRGRLWRTKLAKTAAGYVAQTQQFASLGMLVVDCAVSPAGDFVICCHSGPPDWGNGPQGEGRLYKLRYQDKAAPQPVLTWPTSETETVIAFDRPLEAGEWQDIGRRTRIESGRYVAAADRFESIRPGYAVVTMQQEQVRTGVPVKAARLSPDRREIILETAPRTAAVTYALTLSGRETLDTAHDLSGMIAEWTGGDGANWSGWLPHPDFTAARAFTAASARHDALWQHLSRPGSLTLNGLMDPWQMLTPATQPISTLDYTPEPETVTVVFKADAALQLTAPGAKVERVSDRESKFTVAAPQQHQWQPVSVKIATPARALSVSFSTARDPRPRALPTRRWLMPFAGQAPPDQAKRSVPEIAGGNWEAGRALFKGKAICATCHQLHGEGVKVGPELSNLMHRDYATVLHDIADPSAMLNPDAVAYTVTRKDGSTVTGVRFAENAQELHIGMPGGTVERLEKADILKAEPLKTSLMPAGLDKTLTTEELRDLMTFLLTAPPPPGKPN